MKGKRLWSVFVMLAMLLAVMPAAPASAAASINIGEYLEMGTYYGEPILWRCVDIDENGPLMLSDRILCIKPFDASGNNTSGSHGRSNVNTRKQNGSNYWADSNIRSWLNSDANAGQVMWMCGNKPDEAHVYGGSNEYDREAGFKTGFAAEELSAVKTVNQDSLLQYNEYDNMSSYGNAPYIYKSNVSEVVQNAKSTAYRENIIDRFFLIDVNQLYAIYKNSNILGNDYYFGRLTAQAVAHSETTASAFVEGRKWHYWLRTPYASHSYGSIVHYVNVRGEIDISNANGRIYGIRPAFYLKLSTTSFISGNGTASNPYRIVKNGKISVHKNNNLNIANNITSNLNSILSSVTLCDTKIQGPSFKLGKHTVSPLQFDAKAVLNLSGLSKNITIDEENKKVHVILGKKNADGNASIVRTTKTVDSTWSEQYHEIKDMYKSLTGLEKKGSDRNGVNNWNKFEKLKGQLNRMNCDMFIKGSMSCVAYMDFDYHTGALRLSEGGIVETASLGVDLNYPIAGNFLYATLGLTGSETGTIKAVVNSSGTIEPQMSIEPSITAKASLTGQIPNIGKAEGGIDATLAVLLQTFDPKLTVKMSGKIFLNATVLNYTLIDWERPYLNVELYPEFKDNLSTNSISSSGINSTVLRARAKATPRGYIMKNTLRSAAQLRSDNSIYTQNNVYPNNDAQLVSLGGNSMMLIWLGDDGTKSEINRSSLMYSIYKNGSWSEAKKIAEDGTAAGSFKAVSNGSDVYIVYQKANSVLADDVSLEDMMKDIDLYEVTYSDGAFGEPICVTDYDNEAYEFVSDVEYNNGTLDIAWVENSANDIFMSEGTSCIKTRSISGNSLGEVINAGEFDSDNGEYSGSVHIDGDKLYYAKYISGDETKAYLYEYANGSANQLFEADGIYNLDSIGNTLYYIKDSTVYSYADGTETETGIENTADFKIVSNGAEYAMLMTISEGSRNEIYISRLENGEWTHPERFTDLGVYIRSYSPFMYSNGSINLAVSAAVVNDDISGGESVYGDTSMMVLEQCKYFDISSSYLYYDEDIEPGKDITLNFDVYNDSAEKLESVKAVLTDRSGTELAQYNVPCDIEAFSKDVLSVVYTLPENLTETALNLTVSTERTENDNTNNTVSTGYGYADVAVTDIECNVNTDNTADIGATIRNTGYSDAEDVVIKVYNGSLDEEVLDEIEVGTMAAGEIRNVSYTFPAELMVAPFEDAMNAVYIQAETSSDEASYANNEQKTAFDSYIDPAEYFTTTADSGYYAETADSEEKIGAISFNSVFDLGADYTVNMSEYGFDLFKDGSEDNKKTLSADFETEFTGGMVKFYATIENIPSTDFDVELSAIPYVVIDGETISGNACIYSVTQGGKWLGTKAD